MPFRLAAWYEREFMNPKAPFGEPGERRPTFLGTMFCSASVVRCVRVALIVGTLLSLINQGAVVFGGHATDVTWLRVASNYAMPFLVSSIGFYLSQRHLWAPARSQDSD